MIKQIARGKAGPFSAQVCRHEGRTVGTAPCTVLVGIPYTLRPSQQLNPLHHMSGGYIAVDANGGSSVCARVHTRMHVRP